MISIADKTEILIQALPYIQQYEQKTFVIKYGGAAMVDEDLKETFAQDVTLLKKIGVRMVIVHGGGKDITDLAGKIGLESRFVKGQRYTDADMMGVVQMVLGGKTNQDIVARINQHDGGAVGLSGVDNGLFLVRRHTDGGTDLGFVGDVVRVNTKFLETLFATGHHAGDRADRGGPRGAGLQYQCRHGRGESGGGLAGGEARLSQRRARRDGEG